MGRAVDPLRRGRAAEAGFTLIELLVAVAVLSVLAVGAALTASRPATPGESDIARFRDRFETLRALAVQGQQTRGLVLESGGMRPARRENGAWVMAGHLQSWRGRAVWRVEERRSAGSAPDILFLPNGRTSAFAITFAGTGNRTVRCSSDGWTGLVCGG